jgi:hypothetical protein
VTAAALYLLLERAGASPEEARSPGVLLTSLWLLESVSSQYRSSAKVCLEDYTNYTGEPGTAGCGGGRPQPHTLRRHNMIKAPLSARAPSEPAPATPLPQTWRCPRSCS